MLALVAVVALVLANGFFVATEFAFVSVRRTRIQHLAAGGNHRARRLLGRLDHLDAYIAATQLGITMASLALGWIGEPALAHLVEPLLAHLPFLSTVTRTAVVDSLGVAIAFSVITTLHIVFGELAPKSLALQRAEETSLFAATPIEWFYAIFRPIIAALNAVGNGVVRLLGIEPASGHAVALSGDELMLALDASEVSGLVSEAAHDLVDRAFAFTGLRVRQVMVPRTEMVALPADASLDDALLAAGQSGHHLLPLYGRNLDDIAGILNVMRLLPLEVERCRGKAEAARLDLRELATPPFAVPESAVAVEVLNRLRETRTPLAIVIDEYGGTAGLVTITDLAERIVGEIHDELEPADGDPGAGADGSLTLDGLTTLDEARALYGLQLDGEALAVATVGGYVFARLGRKPDLGDEVETPTGWLLRVAALDGLRVARVQVRPAVAREPPAS